MVDYKIVLVGLKPELYDQLKNSEEWIKVQSSVMDVHALQQKSDDSFIYIYLAETRQLFKVIEGPFMHIEDLKGLDFYVYYKDDSVDEIEIAFLK